MALSPEFSIMGGLAVGGVVLATYSAALPSQADLQALPSGQKEIDQAEKRATVISAGVVAGVSILARDPGIFLIGTGFAVALAWWSRWSNYTDSSAGRYLTPSEQAAAGSANTGPAAETEMETTPYEMFQGNDFTR